MSRANSFRFRLSIFFFHFFFSSFSFHSFLSMCIIYTIYIFRKPKRIYTQNIKRELLIVSERRKKKERKKKLNCEVNKMCIGGHFLYGMCIWHMNLLVSMHSAPCRCKWSATFHSTTCNIAFFSHIKLFNAWIEIKK